MSGISRSVVVLLAAAMWLLAQAYRERALEHYRKREFASAAAVLERHLRSKPDDIESRMLQGLCYQQAGELGRAESVLRECVRRQPGKPEPLFYLARVLYEQGKFGEAETSTRAAAAQGYSPSRVAVLEGLIHLEQFHYDAALASFERAQKTARTGEVEPWVQAGKLLLKLGRTEEAVNALEAALQHNPASLEAGRQLERARDLARLLPRAPDTPEKPASVPFLNIAGRSGIDFVLDNHATPNKHLVETMPGGLAAFDYDGDGRLDLYFVNGAPLPGLVKRSPRDWNRLYRNLGDLRFEDVTERTGVAGTGYGMGVAMGDYNSDGRPDLFVAGVRSNQLFRNRGNGAFEEVTLRAGIHRDRWSVAAGWLDYDRDGKLDLFVVNYVDWDPSREPFCGDAAKNFRVYCHPRNYAPTANRLYRNRGDGTFEDVSAKSGVSAHRGKGMSLGVADYDGDGWPDVFVTNDAMQNFLFRNRGDGTFEEVALSAGVALTEDGRPVSGMGTEFQDADNDGRFDVIFTALTGETFPFFRNFGGGQFREWTYPSGLGLATARFAGWGIAVADFNNDGWRDIATANSHVTDNIEQFSADRFRQVNTLFLNSGGRYPAVVPFGMPDAHRGLVAADLDSDGRLDLVVTVLGSKPEIWHNRLDGGNHWIALQVPLGARVRVGDQVAWTSSTVGYASSVLAPLHFGLGGAKVAPPVEITWPDGRTT
ncbi:MAG: FG-GAP-like repeat-containing protein, partial [Bryobacteraceae bacterium]